MRGALSIRFEILIVMSGIITLFQLASYGKAGFGVALFFIFLLFIVSAKVSGFDVTRSFEYPSNQIIIGCLALVGLAWVFWYHLKD